MASKNGQKKNATANQSSDRDEFTLSGVADSKRDRKTGSKRSGRGASNGRGSKSRNGDSGSKFPKNSWNSIEWWARLPELLRAVSSIPYPYKPGMKLPGPTVDAYTGEGTTKVATDISYPLPGIAALRYCFSLGYSNTPQDPASICCAKLYERIRATYSGTLRADATDLFMYVYAVSQVHSYIAYLKRLYRTLNLYSPDNRLFPQALFGAQIGLDMASSDTVLARFVREKPNFEYYINQLVRMINNWYVPADMDILERHTWINEHVYADAPTLAGQMYVLTPDYFYQIGEDESGATKLSPKTVVINADMTPYDLFEFGREMIDAIASVGNSYDMRGYFEKSYTGTPSYISALLMPEEQQVPVFMPEVLGQIHNVVLAGGYYASNITQDKLTHTIYHTPGVSSSSVRYRNRIILDSLSYVPDVASTVLNSRLAVCVRDRRPGETGPLKIACCTEVVRSMYLYTGEYDRYRFWQVPQEIIIDARNGAVDMTQALEDLEYLFETRAWAYFPRLMVHFVFLDTNGAPVIDSALNVAEKFYLYSELVNPTTVDFETLDNMNRVCLYSIFDCFKTRSSSPAKTKEIGSGGKK